MLKNPPKKTKKCEILRVTIKGGNWQDFVGK